MQITHEEARKLIQIKLDHALHDDKRNILDRHLESCMDCRKYASSLEEVEFHLLSLMHRKWDLKPIPHPRGTVRSRRPFKIPAQVILITRMIAMGMICIAFLFNIWQSVQSGIQDGGQPSVGVPPVPTPSMHSTSTDIGYRECEKTLYTVQENDTLETIAHQFSISQEEIISINNLDANRVSLDMRLLIPLCNTTTPETTGTVTRTTTPLTSPTITTPIGIRTQ